MCSQTQIPLTMKVETPTHFKEHKRELNPSSIQGSKQTNNKSEFTL